MAARPHPIVAGVREGLATRADPSRAAGAQAYMKTKQPFYGVPTPERRRLVRGLLGAHPIASQEEYAQVTRALWRGARREEQYAAMDVATLAKAHRTHDAWPLHVEMLDSAESWDTVDWIAAVLLGEYFLGHRQAHEPEVRAWRTDDNLWKRRASLLVHLKHRAHTDTDLVAETALMLAPEREFFIRKAIGWTLREYAKTEPAWVRRFVEQHDNELSGLSKREATKNLA